MNFLHEAGALGGTSPFLTTDELDVPVFVVGGFIRDLLLQVPNDDIDLVVEGMLLGCTSDFALFYFILSFSFLYLP